MQLNNVRSARQLSASGQPRIPHPCIIIVDGATSPIQPKAITTDSSDRCNLQRISNAPYSFPRPDLSNTSFQFAADHANLHPIIAAGEINHRQQHNADLLIKWQTMTKLFKQLSVAGFAQRIDHMTVENVHEHILMRKFK